MWLRISIPAFFAVLLAFAAHPWAQVFWRVVTTACMFYLGLVTLRRFALTTASMKEPPPVDVSEPLEDLLVVIAARNEAAVIAETLAAVSALDWPADRMRVVVVDDASTDGTASIVNEAAKLDERIRLIRMETPGGKGPALNAALAHESFGEWVYVLDADTRPAPDAPRVLLARAEGRGVEAVQGAMTPRNLGSASASHAALESAIHQHITHAGADRLGLTCGLLGANSLLRRSTLAGIGGFAEDLKLEDIDLTVRMLIHGYRAAFEPRAAASILATESAAESARQHRTWFADYRLIAKRHWGEVMRSQLGAVQKADLALFLFSYGDRAILMFYIVCVAAAWIGGAGYAPWWFVAVVASAPLLQVAIAWRRAGLGHGVADMARIAASLVADGVVHATSLFTAQTSPPAGQRTRRTVDDAG